MHLIQEKTKNLANKESAKILVISDSHGQTRNLRSVLEAQKNTCDALVFTGDGISEESAGGRGTGPGRVPLCGLLSFF